ncbi:MAG: protein kinase [bacterium]|nr:protein kinase [bacterium]
MVGQVIRNYEIRELLGRGAMGEVYLAYDRALDRELAVKFLSQDAASSPEDVQRFYLEARAAAGLSHQNVVVIHDVGEHEGRCFFVMELLSGMSLRQMIREGKRPLWKEGLKIAVQVCKALEAAHARNLLHRDIKPENIWLQPDGLVKILDFGIARFSTVDTLTRSDETLGTPEYMAPEQIMGEALDGRTDLYALGIFMYELFTGQRPFTGPNAITVIYKQMEEEPIPPGQLAQDMPLAVERMILKAIAKEPAQRYASAAQMRQEIEALLEGRSEESVPESAAAPESGEVALNFESHLVGRDQEMEALRAAVDDLSQAKGGTVLLGGEAGIGKTRLATETLAYARKQGSLVLRGACLFIEAPEPYLPFLEALGQGLASTQGGGREDLLKFIREEAPELEELVSHVMTVLQTRRTPGMAHLDETVATSKERLFEAITRLLLHLSGEAPVTLFLDDLQWADSGTLQLLYYIARNAVSRRLLIVGTYRTEDLMSEGDERAHPLSDTIQQMSREDLFRDLRIGGLAPGAVGQMLRGIFRRGTFSAAFRDSLYRETGGNPFFVIEVLKLLRDEGVVFQRRGIWRERREITGGDIPRRVYDVVVRRLERLAHDERELLQIAAVVGERFSSGALGEIFEQKRVRVLRSLHRAARVHHLLQAEEEFYSFVHPKIREVLYAEVSPELRREYHLAYAEYLEANSSGEQKRSSGELARHFHFAGAHARALPYLIQAGDRAQRVFAYREARDFYRWGVASLPEEDVLAPGLLQKLGNMYDRLGEVKTAMEQFSRALVLADKQADLTLVAELRRGIGRIHLRSGEYDQAAEQYRRCVKGCCTTSHREAMCDVLIQMGNLHLDKGEWPQVKSCYARALKIARHTGQERQIAMIYMNSGIVASIQGDLDRALRLYERGRERYEKTGYLPGVNQILLNMGWSYGQRELWEKARDAYQEALAIARKTQNIYIEAKCYLNLAEVYLETRDLKACKRASVKALEIFKKSNRQVNIADVFRTLGQVAAVERKWEEAQSYFERSIESLRSLGHVLGEGKSYLEYARMLKLQGDQARALEQLDLAVVRFTQIGAQDDLATAETLRGEIESLQYLAQP